MRIRSLLLLCALFFLLKEVSAQRRAATHPKPVPAYIFDRPSSIQAASFTAPDTVCLGTAVNITNTSAGASTYFWNFCVADVNQAPTANNLGNIGGAFNAPVYIDYVFEGGNYYGFQTNNYPGGLVRLNFGNSLLNTPTVTSLGTVGGIIPNNTEGVQIVKNEGKWYVIIVGGDPVAGNTPSAIVKIELGTNIANNSPTGTYWGNIGNLSYPHDLYVFDDNSHWYGLTVNTANNTITRFDFTTSFSNTPTGVNLGNIGSLTAPTGLHAIRDNGNWYAFVTNANSNTLSRLDFGSSLLNTPTGSNLGTLGGQLRTPWDIYMIQYCGKKLAFLINAETNTLAKLDFGNSILSTPTVADYGNTGDMNFPHCLSKVFRVGADVYTLVSNVGNNTLSRIRFEGCTSSSVPNSTLQQPPSIIYNTIGSYNINLAVDDGLATQSAFCKQVVVVAKPTNVPIPDASICPGNSVTLNSGITGATSISWSPTAGLSNPSIANPVAAPLITTEYIVTGTGPGGCLVKDTVLITVKTPAQCQSATVTPNFVTPDTVCVGTPVNITNNTVGASSYYWNFCTANVNQMPIGTSLGNPGNALSIPVFMDYAFENGNYYGIMVNNAPPGGLLRFNFGNSLLNAPTVTNLGNFGGLIPRSLQGIQLVKSNGRWYAIIVGGDPFAGVTSRIIKADFGTALTNTPTITNWGNIGSLAYPHDIYVFNDASNWYGFTVNYDDGTVTRFNFGADFTGTPTGVNIGNLGNLNKPSGIFPINDNGTWRVFVANFGSNTLSRIDFGNTLLNAPTAAVNMGNVGGVLNTPRDLYILNYCGQTTGFLINDNSADLVRMNFSSLSATPTAVSLGTTGGMNKPHSISKIFRAGADLFAFVPNSNNNTLTRLRFSGCNNSSIPNSSAQNPSPVTYNAPGTYNITLTVDDGLPTQASYCRSVVVLAPPAHSPTKSFSICRGGQVRIGSSLKPGTYLWNTGATTDSITVTAAGTYWVESNPYGCAVRDSFVVTGTVTPAIDFGYREDLCNPNSVQFTAALPASVQSFTWSFGNGQFNAVTQAPSTVYASAGNYTVKLLVVFTSGCTDSVERTISTGTVFDNGLVFNGDTTICLGDSVRLRPNSAALAGCWNASTGASPTAMNGFVKPITSTLYTFTGQVTGPNLVTNPRFAAGNTGFTSDYVHAFPNTAEGQYWIGANASTWNLNMSNCADTGPDGNMMAVNGSATANAKVWSQTVPVTPNTEYVFSIWLQSLMTINPASLQFSINSVNLGNSITASSSTCQWNQFTSGWNSGASTSAVITIINKNTVASGNDFALDDIFFGTATLRTDSFRVNVTGFCDSIRLTGRDKICSAKDTVTYSIYRSANCTQAFNVQVDPAFVEVISQTANTLRLRYLQDGQTTIRVSFSNACKVVRDSLKINVKFAPSVINFGPDIANCRDTSFTLHAGPGFDTYLWSNGTTDSNFVVTAPGTYHVMAQNICGAQFRDTMVLTKSVLTPFAAAPPNVSACAGDSVQFSASGGSIYEWQPAARFARPAAAVSKALISATQDYTVHITDPVCQRDTLVIIPVRALTGASISIIKSNDVTCSNDSAQLIASGGTVYTWTPNLYITRSNASGITVKPPQSTTYYVAGRTPQGCEGKDSVTVKFVKEGDQKLYIPTAFTPNGDGLNDIFKPVFIGPAAKYDFRVYNRWGALVFRTSDPGAGWDGTYKGKHQPKDAYVFYITAEGGCNGRFEQKGTFVLIK